MAFQWKHTINMSQKLQIYFFSPADLFYNDVAYSYSLQNCYNSKILEMTYMPITRFWLNKLCCFYIGIQKEEDLYEPIYIYYLKSKVQKSVCILH